MCMNKRLARPVSIFGLLCVGVLAVNSASATKIYTPQQLRSMVKAGKYPEQSKPTVQSQRMDYSTCISKVAAVVNSVQSDYPTTTVLSTNTSRIEKVWTNDAAMTLTCSAADGTLVITTAPYL